MNPVRLLRADGADFAAYQCGQCRNIYTSNLASKKQVDDYHGLHLRPPTPEEHHAYAVDLATRCCDWKCNHCGEKAFAPYQQICRNCQNRKDAARRASREAEAFRKAKERTDYDGPFLDGIHVYETLEDLIESFDSDELPEYVWVPKEVAFHIDAERVVENALEDHYEVAGDRIDYEDIVQLQTLLDAWCKAQGIVSYEESHKEYVRIPKECNR